MKIAQYPANYPLVDSGNRTGRRAAEMSAGKSVLQKEDNAKGKQTPEAKFVDRSRQIEARLNRGNIIPVQLLNQRAIDTYNINSTYTLFGGEGELIGLDLHA
jgi:hypothetical protein